MSKEKRIAIIVEGEKFEKQIVKSINRNFFAQDNRIKYTIIPLPMAANLYILWKEISNDEFLDIIEIVREKSSNAKVLEGLDRASFSEVYLFFDYDCHQNNLSTYDDPDSILIKMLETFDNETENGKLYISYPMAEAIRDCKTGCCWSFSNQCYHLQADRKYKEITGADNPLSHVTAYTVNRWADFINVYRGRLSCLLKKDDILSIKECKSITASDIYTMQRDNIASASLGMIVLSAFPMFLIDYFKEDYLLSIIGNRDFTYPNCEYPGIVKPSVH